MKVYYVIICEHGKDIESQFFYSKKVATEAFEQLEKETSIATKGVIGYLKIKNKYIRKKLGIKLPKKNVPLTLEQAKEKCMEVEKENETKCK